MEHLEPAKLILKMIKDCWFNTDYTLLPGQWLVLQDWFMRLGPWHRSPPHSGEGFVQLRIRLCDPPPQVRLHLSHGPQDDQLPLSMPATIANWMQKSIAHSFKFLISYRRGSRILDRKLNKSEEIQCKNNLLKVKWIHHAKDAH